VDKATLIALQVLLAVDPHRPVTPEYLLSAICYLLSGLNGRAYRPFVIGLKRR
jgi:hypothetical protein